MLLGDVEDLDPVVAGVGDVDAPARFVEQNVLQAFVAGGVAACAVRIRVQGGGYRVDHAALIALPVVHVDADGVGDVDGFGR